MVRAGVESANNTGTQLFALTTQTEEPPMSESILRWLVGIAALVLAVEVIGVLIYGSVNKPGWVGVTDKKVWNFLAVFLVPLALALGATWITLDQNRRQRNADNLRRDLETKAEEARDKREREAENQRAQDEALQAYLDQMSRLLLDKDRPLRHSEEGDDVRILARARTLTALTRLSERKRSVLQFLYESQLIDKDCSLADIRGANLSRGNLSEIYLTNADLRDTDLRNTELVGAELSGAELSRANLSEADLQGASLRRAIVSYADLQGANLSGVLFGAADLRGSNLQGADCRKADFWMTDFQGADLSGTTGIITKELEQKAYSLEGAIMPNGQEYEDWLNDRESRGEDEENSEPS